jgi:hypothetical protein
MLQFPRQPPALVDHRQGCLPTVWRFLFYGLVFNIISPITKKATGSEDASGFTDSESRETAILRPFSHQI